MIEFIEHTLGLCGEKHFNIAAVILDWQNFSPILNYIKSLFK
jgi:hypothetical protein